MKIFNEIRQTESLLLEEGLIPVRVRAKRISNLRRRMHEAVKTCLRGYPVIQKERELW